MPKKKILLFIVEGQTDETALATALSRILLVNLPRLKSRASHPLGIGLSVLGYSRALEKRHPLRVMFPQRG